MSHSSPTARRQGLSPAVQKMHDDIWNDLRRPDRNQISDQDLLVFCKACFAFEGKDVQALKITMDKDNDDEVGKSDFETSMCDVINKLWNEAECYKHADKTWDVTELEREKFQQKVLKRFRETSQKISTNRAQVGPGASSEQSGKRDITPDKKRKLLGVIALTDEAFLDTWKINTKWKVLNTWIDDEQIDRIWTAFLLHHEDAPLSAHVKQLPEHVLSCTAEDPTKGRELAKLELQAKEQQRLMDQMLTQSPVIVRDPVLTQDPKTDSSCRACTACSMM